MVIITEAPPAGGAPRSAHSWSSPKYIMLTVAMLLLAAVFVLVIVRIAADVPVANNHVTSSEKNSSTSANSRMGSVGKHVYAPPVRAQEPTHVNSLVLINNHMEPFSEPTPPPCGGDKPGVCPGFSATPAQSGMSTVSAGSPTQTSPRLLTPPSPPPGMSSPPG